MPRIVWQNMNLTWLAAGVVVLVLALLIAAGPGARQMLRAVVWFALALIAVTIPIGLAGLALPLRAVEMAIAMTAGIAALGNLRSHPIPPGWLAIGCGVTHGLGLGARVREASLAPLRPVDCLLPFLAGVAGVVILASTMTAFVLMAMGAWNKGNIVSRAISLASLLVPSITVNKLISESAKSLLAKISNGSQAIPSWLARSDTI
jgi:hypothetical protein